MPSHIKNKDKNTNSVHSNTQSTRSSSSRTTSSTSRASGSQSRIEIHSQENPISQSLMQNKSSQISSLFKLLKVQPKHTSSKSSNSFEEIDERCKKFNDCLSEISAEKFGQSNKIKKEFDSLAKTYKSYLNEILSLIEQPTDQDKIQQHKNQLKEINSKIKELCDKLPQSYREQLKEAYRYPKKHTHNITDPESIIMWITDYHVMGAIRNENLLQLFSKKDVKENPQREKLLNELLDFNTASSYYKEKKSNAINDSAYGEIKKEIDECKEQVLDNTMNNTKALDEKLNNMAQTYQNYIRETAAINLKKNKSKAETQELSRRKQNIKALIKEVDVLRCTVYQKENGKINKNERKEYNQLIDIMNDILECGTTRDPSKLNALIPDTKLNYEEKRVCIGKLFE